MTFVLFVAFSLIAVSGALGVVLSRNPVYSALFLVMTMVTMAAFFLLLEAPMVAIVQVIVYASAIVVLFLFVIMLLGVDRHEFDGGEHSKVQRPAAALLGLLTLAGLLLITLSHWQIGSPDPSSTSISDKGDHIRPVARVLFTRFAWPFEITAVLLVIAVVGAVVLARRSQRPSREVAS